MRAARRFPVGGTVKVVGPFPGRWRWQEKYEGCIGTVHSIYDSGPKGYVNVSFGPVDAVADQVFRPDNVQRGRVEWIPEDEDAT